MNEWMNVKMVEVGMKLDKSISYYHDLLTKNGLRLDFCCISIFLN